MSLEASMEMIRLGNYFCLYGEFQLIVVIMMLTKRIQKMDKFYFKSKKEVTSINSSEVWKRTFSIK